MNPTDRRIWFGMAALVLAAGALRLAWLRDLPPALWYDEAINGLDAWRMLQERRLPMFFDTGGHPREPLYLWMVAAMEALAGPSPAVIRATSAIVGILTVPLFWWMLRGVPTESVRDSAAADVTDPAGAPSAKSDFLLANPVILAFAAAAALAALRWHVHFSRTCFRTILTPMFIILVLGFLVRGFQHRRLREFCFAGVALGLGFYTYLAFRFAPLIVAVALFHPEWRRRWLRARGDWKLLGAMAAAALIAFAPLLIHYARQPEHFTGRTDQVTLFSEGLGPGLRQVGGNALDVAGMFSWPGRGDHVPKHNVPNQPVFAWTAALFFYLGLGVGVWRARRRALDAVMLVWLVVILQASIWSFGAPNLLRTVGATPAVAYFLAVGWLAAAEFAVRRLLGAWDQRRRIVAKLAMIAALFLVYAVPQTVDYFHTWARDPRVPRDFNDTYAEAAAFARQATAEGAVVLLHDELYYHPTAEFLLLRSPEVLALTLDNIEDYASAWREGRSPFNPSAPVFLMFLPTGSALERQAIEAIHPTDRRRLGPFPLYLTPARPAPLTP